MANIIEKILNIQQTIQVEKLGVNEKHGFTYFREEDIVNAVRDQLNQHGIIVQKEMASYDHVGIYDTNGRYRPRASGTVKFTFISVDDGSEFEVSVGAEGSGTGDDVSSRKLATQARKIASLDTFQIGESNDRYDSDSQGEQEPINMTPPPAPQATVAGLMDEIGKLVNDKVTDGPTVNTVGSRIAKELGIDPTPKAWRRDSRVLEPLIAAIVAGEVE